MSERTRNLLAAGVITGSLSVIVAVLAAAPPSAADRVHHLASILKCPVCTSESIASSPAELSRDLLVVIAERVDQGWTDQEILDFFVATYGEEVLLDPPRGVRTVALWLLPVVAGAVGIGAVLGRRRRARPSPVTDEDRRRVEEALRHRERP